MFAVFLMLHTKSQSCTWINFAMEDSTHAKYFVLAYPKDTSLFKIEEGHLFVLRQCYWNQIPIRGNPLLVQKRKGRNYVTISFISKDNPGKIIFIKYNRKEFIFTQNKTPHSTFAVRGLLLPI